MKAGERMAFGAACSALQFDAENNFPGLVTLRPNSCSNQQTQKNSETPTMQSQPA